MEPRTPDSTRNESLVGKYDARSVSLRFGNLPSIIVAQMGLIFDDSNLDMTYCFSFDCLKKFSEEERKLLCGFMDDLALAVKDEEKQKEIIGSMIEILNS